MRLAYGSDFHGDIERYRALLDLAVAYQAEAAIVGGDLLPHSIKLEKAIGVQQSFISDWLHPLFAAFHTAHPGIRVYLLPGNDDWAAAIELLSDLEAEGIAFPLHQRVYPLEIGLWLAGYASVPITPFSIKDYEQPDDGPMPPYSFAMAYGSQGGSISPLLAEDILSRPGIAEELSALGRCSPPQHTIYVCHTPPANTPIDTMSGGKHVGSRALRRFIEQHAPPLTLHGHIHEAPTMTGRYAVRIGPTWCVNPGRSQGDFHAVTLDTADIAGTMTHTLFGRP